jgi:tetratricopeptide (TPR) repeat protein
MGAVYHAWDNTLRVPIAIKVIRPEISANSDDAEALLQRFKRELLLARQVTHPNVLRIHDFGDVDGVTYITMPYIEGADLRTLLTRERPLPLERVLRIARQVASGLAAAHAAGVIHRDLKPANVMISAHDKALIMDFGSARSGGISEAELTGAGGVVGTVAYMAPEQVQSATVDHRADIYAFGLIVRDMLVPRELHGGAVADLMKRAIAPPPSTRSIDPAIPEWLDALVTRCLEPNADARYQSMTDVVDLLDRAAEGLPLAPAVGLAHEPATTTRHTVRRLLPALIALALLMALTTGASIMRSRVGVVSGPVGVVVLGFRNASGDPSLDTLGDTLSATLATMLGHSSRLRTVAPERLTQVLRGLRISSNATLRPEELARLADHTNARKVLTGQITFYDGRIRIDTMLQDVGGREPVPLYPVAARKERLLGALTELATRVQTQLAGGSDDILNQLKSTAWRPSTDSLQALRLYYEGINLSRQRADRNALERFEAAVGADGSFALALAALARTYAALGRDKQAAEMSHQALILSESLPAQEKYRVEAAHYQIVNNPDRAIEAHKNILDVSPGDTLVRFDLGSLYEMRSALDDAREQFEAIVEVDPKFVEALLAAGRIAIRRGVSQESLPYLERARSAAIELTHHSTENILQALGIAYKQLNKLDDALKHYEEALEMRRLLDADLGMAGTLSEIGMIQSRKGNFEAAFRSYDEALRIRRKLGDRRDIGLGLINLGTLYRERRQFDLALTTFAESLQIQREVGNRVLESLCLNAIGGLHLQMGQYGDATKSFEQALTLREKLNQPLDQADTLHNLGEVAARTGAFDAALAYYTRASGLRQSDERARAVESIGAAAVLGWQGRFAEAVNTTQRAYDVLRRLNDPSPRYVEILISHGTALSQNGQTAEARPLFAEALALARQMKHPVLVALATAAEGERLLLQGNREGARGALDGALREARNAANNEATVLIRVNLAKVNDPRATESSTESLAKLAADADATGLKYAAAEAALLLAESQIRSTQYQQARGALEGALPDLERMRVRVPEAKARVLLARTYAGLRMAEDARREYAAARRVLDRLGSEPGHEKVLERRDLAGAYDEARREAADERR